MAFLDDVGIATTLSKKPTNICFIHIHSVNFVAAPSPNPWVLDTFHKSSTQYSTSCSSYGGHPLLNSPWTPFGDSCTCFVSCDVLMHLYKGGQVLFSTLVPPLGRGTVHVDNTLVTQITYLNNPIFQTFEQLSSSEKKKERLTLGLWAWHEEVFLDSKSNYLLLVNTI